ncbi:hypothetical protein B7463_g4784, partial [Scytalidium lignicola]
MALKDFFIDSQDELLHQPGSSAVSSCSLPSATTKNYGIIHEIAALITAAPELRVRSPEPQDAGDACSQASESASQAIQQASQQASDSIRQASQQASQSIQQASQQASQASRQASQSASQAIQQAQNTASQQIAAASRSISSAVSSANSVMSSVSASAANAISQATSRMSAAQASASSAQAEASKAIQAGAAVAAATGSAAAVGSSFLSAAAKATEGAQASVSAFGSAASSQIAVASQQVKASQVQAVTATQAAIAIVGSIIASSLLSILIFYLITRRRKKKEGRVQMSRSPGLSRRDLVSPRPEYQPEPKPPFSADGESTLVNLQSNYAGTRDVPESSASRSSFSLFPKPPSGKYNPKDQKNVDLKTTSVPWNPANPPKVPALGSWLKLQSETISPFGPIQLSTDIDSNAPLGGQLKSPLRSMDRPGSSSPTRKPIGSSPKKTTTTETLSTRKDDSPSKTNPIRPVQFQNQNQTKSPSPDTILRVYRASKASVWTDDVPSPTPPPTTTTPGTASIKIQFSPNANSVMRFPAPIQPVRDTAEWLSERQRGSRNIGSRDSTSSSNAPNNARGLGLPFGLPSNPGIGLLAKQRSLRAEIGYVNDNDDEEGEKGKGKGKMRASGGSEGSRIRTPGVGKAM